MEPNLPTADNEISKPKRWCAVHDCNTKTTDTYCEGHKDLAKQWGKSEVHPWYQLKLWRGNPNLKFGKRGGLREKQLLQEPLCEHCQQKGITRPATVADHKIPWKTGETEAEQWELFTDFDNLQSLCESCHNRKGAKERAKGNK